MSLKGTLKIDVKRVITICTTVMVALTFVMTVLIVTDNSVTKTDSIQATNEIINNIDSLVTNTDESVDMLELNQDIANDAMIETYSLEANNIESDEDSMAGSIGDLEGQNTTLAPDYDPYQIIVSDIEAIKSSNQTVIEKYFGGSATFSPDIVADKLAATTVTFVSSEVIDTTTTVNVHICTLDYNKMLEADKKFKQEQLDKGETEENSKEFSKKELAKGVVNGEYALHYTVPVKVANGSVEITEAFKEAITGGWYKGIDVQLQPVECPLKAEE